MPVVSMRGPSGASGASTTRETNFSWNGPKPIASSAISTLAPSRRRMRAGVAPRQEFGIARHVGHQLEELLGA